MRVLKKNSGSFFVGFYDHPISLSCPREVFRTKPLFEKTFIRDLLLTLVCLVLASFGLGGWHLIERHSIIQLNRKTPAHVYDTLEHKNLRRHFSYVLKALYFDEKHDAQKVELSVGGKGYRQFHAIIEEFSSAPDMARQYRTMADATTISIYYDPSNPKRAVLENDFGHSSMLLMTILLTLLTYVVLVGFAYAYKYWIWEKRIVHLLTHGKAVLFRTTSAWTGSYSLEFEHEGKNHKIRIPNFRIWRATLFHEGYVALIDQKKPTHFIIYRGVPFDLKPPTG